MNREVRLFFFAIIPSQKGTLHFMEYCTDINVIKPGTPKRM
jgi:hypothetical protein